MQYSNSDFSGSESRSSRTGVQHQPAGIEVVDKVGAAPLDPSVLRELLRVSEDDLAEARVSLLQAEARAERTEADVSELEKHVAAIEADIARFRGQASGRGLELSELRALLGAFVLARDELQDILGSERAERAALRRLVCELRPRAESNGVAMATVSALGAERARLRNDLALLQRELDAVRASTFWRMAAPARWVVSRLRGHR